MTLIYFILILGITVMFHEFGHYIYAKKFGIYVYEFSIGMGPRLFKWKRKNDETEYSLRLLPIGGYVSLAGEEEVRNPDIPKGRSLQDIRFIKKFMITIAGVLNNFILAIVLLFIIGLFAGYNNTSLTISQVKEDGSAYGLIIPGDKIIKVNGHRVNNEDKLLLELQLIKDDVTFTLENNGRTKDVTLKNSKEVKDGTEVYNFGFSLDNNTSKGFIAAVKYAFHKFVSLFEQMIFILWYLITGKIGINSLSGPVGIYVLVGTVAKQGFLNIIYLMAYISLNVGIINILPFPAFDGGRAFIYIIEKISGKKIKQKTENIINSIGLIILMLLMVYVTINDIFNLI